MSMELLRELNGNRRGAFSKLLRTFDHEPRIAWYPSAGVDLHGLLYLSSAYAIIHPAQAQEPPPPDIYLHTDYLPWTAGTFLDTKIAFKDNRTTITVDEIDELPRLDLLLDGGIVCFPGRNVATGRLLFVWLNIESTTLGKHRSPLIYALVENAAFCAEKVFACGGKFSHIVHVRFGGGCGGEGKSSGVWITPLLRRLGCEVFVTDGHGDVREGDRRAIELFPELSQGTAESQLQPIRRIDGRSWSDHGDITWYLVR